MTSSENPLDRIPITAERLELLGLKEHPLLNKPVRDLTREELFEVAVLCQRCAEENFRQALETGTPEQREQARAGLEMFRKLDGKQQ